MNKPVIAQMMFRHLVFFAIVLCTLFGVCSTAGAVEPGPTDIDDLFDWITSLQYTDPSLPSYGAIKVHHTSGHVVSPDSSFFQVQPYFANLGVVGLLKAEVETVSHEAALAVAERWINWYLKHRRPYENNSSHSPGMVLDHWYLEDGTGETTAPRYCEPPPNPHNPLADCDHDDATDSYAATFLGLVWTYYQEGGNTQFLTDPGKKAKFETIGEVILELQQADGLMWAKHDHPVKNLMDNSEVFWGLQSMANLEREVFGDPVAALHYEMVAEDVRQGIERDFFDEASGLYRRWAKDAEGEFSEADFNFNPANPKPPPSWYADTVALVWPYLFGVINPSSDRAVMQMKVLHNTWNGSIWGNEHIEYMMPDWTRNLQPAGDPWTSIGYAALLVGAEEQALTHAQLVKSEKLPPNAIFPWPFTVNDAGWLLRTLSSASEACKAARSEAAPLPQTFSMAQNYPNPFNSSTVIRFALPESQDIELGVYNLAGQKVATLAESRREAGVYAIDWDGRDNRGREMASGVYLYRLQAGGQVKSRKLLLLR